MTAVKKGKYKSRSATKGLSQKFEPGQELKNQVTGPTRLADPVFFSLLITVVFLLLALTGILNHEMWRDEYQAWLVARDANSLPELFENVKYEGHPALWHLLLFLITLFTEDPFYMQLFHVVIAAAAIYVFNRYAEMPKTFRVMFSFGYFPLYEFAVISRSYGLGLLLLFIIAALYKTRHRNYLLIGVMLALLANNTVYGLIISFALMGILIIDFLFFQEKGKKQLNALVTGGLIFLAGMIFSIYQIWPEADNTFPAQYATEVLDIRRWGFVLSKLFSVYFYVPDLSSTNFWNTSTFTTMDIPIDPWPGLLMGLVGIAAGVITFLRKPIILLLYSGLTVSLLVLFYYSGLLHVRYCGHLLIVLVLCYWLAGYYPDHTYKNPQMKALASVGKSIGKGFFFLVLALNIIGAVTAYIFDYSEKFSRGKDLANYIRENRLDSLTIMGTPDFTLSPLSAHLHKRIYYPQMNDFGSFTIWSSKRTNEVDATILLGSIHRLFANGRTKVLLVQPNPLEIVEGGAKKFLSQAMLAPDVKIDFLTGFEEGIVADEKYFLYLVQKADPAVDENQEYIKLY